MLAHSLKEPGLCLPELVHAVSVVREQGHVQPSRCVCQRELQLEFNPVGLSLGLKLGALAAKLLSGFGVLGVSATLTSSDAIFLSRPAIYFS